MSLGTIAGTVVVGVVGAYGQHEENKANEKSDRRNKADAEEGYQRAVGHQQQANNFALAQYSPYMAGGLNAWNSMQQGMNGDGAFNNYDPNAGTGRVTYGLTEGQSGVKGGYIPGAASVAAMSSPMQQSYLAAQSNSGGGQPSGSGLLDSPSSQSAALGSMGNFVSGMNPGEGNAMRGAAKFKRPEYLEESKEDIARRRGIR